MVNKLIHSLIFAKHRLVECDQKVDEDTNLGGEKLAAGIEGINADIAAPLIGGQHLHQQLCRRGRSRAPSASTHSHVVGHHNDNRERDKRGAKHPS